MSVILDHRALEPALPHMTGGVVSLVIAPGVGHGQGLKDSTDRLPALGPEQEVEVIGHQAIAEESEGVAVLGLGEGFQEGDAVAVVTEDILAVVPPVEGVIDQTVVDGAR